tara:strand:+ start:1418 stop:3370 length:1953 start_codon:yes stop_codon:yes gene_type:complete
MCGITGFISSELKENNLKKIAIHMSNKLLHRGPDDSGVWLDSEVGIALAHRRLSIVDLSNAGKQPMISNCSRYCIVFNGEIYNHLSLRKELPNSINWKGYSDTETLVNAISLWGIQKTLKKLVGMFAFAIWDRNLKRLILARDRIGEKPLYYGLNGRNLLFASELKAIIAFPNFHSEINRESLSKYIKFGFIPSPYSIYKGIYKLRPGNYIEFSMKDIELRSIPQPSIYWSLESSILSKNNSSYLYSKYDTIEYLESLLTNSIKGQLLGDVSIGTFLSGGIDSSIIVSILQSQINKPINTFTIGFDEKHFDESEKASKVASFIGTNHKKLFLSSKKALEIIPNLSTIYDEPFSDVSQIPTIFMSQFCSTEVKICLSGDGGDELFCGYNRHIVGPKIWNILNYIPISIRKLIADFILYFPPTTWDKFYYSCEKFLPDFLRINAPGLKLQKLTNLINAKTLQEVYLNLLYAWQNSENIVLNSSSIEDKYSNHPYEIFQDSYHQMMFMDFIGYLPNDILVKVDRAAMSSSLETRLPFLDHRVVEFAWKIPINMKLRDNQSKWILRQLLKKYLPDKLTKGPKKGFAVPIAEWLRGPLKNWADVLLDKNFIDSQGYLQADPIIKKWNEHLSGKRDWSKQLWTVLIFQSWLSKLKN